jgi:hypothetical protein
VLLSSGKGTEATSQSFRLALPETPSIVDVSLHSPEDGNRASFRNVVFAIYLGFRMMHKVQRPSNSEPINLLSW